MYTGSRCTKKYHIKIKLNVLHFKSTEMQSKRCDCGGVLQVCHLQAMPPFAALLGIEVCRPILRYSAGVVEWKNRELKELHRKTRKMMTLHGAFDSKSDLDRMYRYPPRQKKRKRIDQL